VIFTNYIFFEWNYDCFSHETIFFFNRERLAWQQISICEVFSVLLFTIALHFYSYKFSCIFILKFTTWKMAEDVSKIVLENSNALIQKEDICVAYSFVYLISQISFTIVFKRGIAWFTTFFILFLIRIKSKIKIVQKSMIKMTFKMYLFLLDQLNMFKNLSKRASISGNI